MNSNKKYKMRISYNRMKMLLKGKTRKVLYKAIDA